MVCKGTSTIQLCWIFFLFFPFTLGQNFVDFGFPPGLRPGQEPSDRSGRFRNSADSDNSGRSRNFGNNRDGSRNRGGFGDRDGSDDRDRSGNRNRFGNSGDSRNSSSQSTEATSSSRALSTTSSTSSFLSIITSSSISSTSTTTAVAATSNTAAMGAAPSSFALPIASPVVQTSIFVAPTSNVAPPPVRVTSATIPTSSAVPLEDTNQQASGQLALSPTPTPSQASSSETIPIAQSEREGLSPMGQLGVSFGITFGILIIAAGIAIWIWWRRRHPRVVINGEDVKDESEDTKRPRFPKFGSSLSSLSSLGGYFKRKKGSEYNDDPEWSIESAERVAIVTNAQPQSVRTVTRSNSKSSLRAEDSDGAKKLKEDRTNGLALNPITPKSAVFPLPPSAVEIEKMSEKPVVQQPSDWPLSR